LCWGGGLYLILVLFVIFCLSSPGLKAVVSFSDSPLSVWPSVFYICGLFSRTADPFLTKVGKTLPWVKEIQNWLNEGQSPSPRGDTSKIHWFFLKGIQICLNKGLCPLQRGLQRGDNYKLHSSREGSLKNIFKNLWTRKAQIYLTPFWYSADTSLFIPWSLGVGWGHNRYNNFYVRLWGENIFKIFSRNTESEKLKFTWKLSDIVQNHVSKNHGR
jgi:hypothetical protein